MYCVQYKLEGECPYYQPARCDFTKYFYLQCYLVIVETLCTTKSVMYGIVWVKKVKMVFYIEANLFFISRPNSCGGCLSIMSTISGLLLLEARFCCNRVITEWVQTLTLPGLIKKIILQHFANLQGSRTNYYGVKFCICLQQYISKGLKLALKPYFICMKNWPLL